MCVFVCVCVSALDICMSNFMYLLYSVFFSVASK